MVEHHPTAKLIVVIITCPVPKIVIDIIPRSVSIIDHDYCPDKVENSLRVIYDRPEGKIKDFAVCHKSLRFSAVDLSLRLVEWIEMQIILGAELVEIYSLGVHPNIEKALKYYHDKVFLIIDILQIIIKLY